MKIFNKKFVLVEFIQNNKMEIAVGAGVMAGLLILDRAKMRHSSHNPETVIFIINN